MDVAAAARRTVVRVPYLLTVTYLWLTIWALAAHIAPAAVGWQPLAVSSASMRPVMEPGDMLAIAPAADPEQMPLGAVVTFDPGDGELVTHRVYRLHPDGFYTKGDANRVADHDVVAPQQVVGVAKFLVPAVSWPRVWLTRGQHTTVALWLAATFVICRSALRDPHAETADA